MCQDCAHNGPTMIAGVNLSTYLKADSKKKPWTLKLCPDLEAKLMMVLSRRLRSDAMVYYDPNKIPANLLIDQLINDIDLNFDYEHKLRKIVFRGLMAQAKGILSDAIAWETIFKVENGKDLNLFQWRVGFILNDMTTVENAKKYILAKRAEEDQIHQQRASMAQSARPPLTITTNFAPSQYPAAIPQPSTQPTQGFKEGLDSISASHSSFDIGSAAAGTAANPIALDNDQDGEPSRYTHAHAPQVSSPLATVPPYTATDLVAHVPRTRVEPETGSYVPIANVTVLGDHRPAKRRSSAASARGTRPPSRRRGRRANAT